MGLSNDLISQFVKATNDDKPSTKESIAYGTVRIDSNGGEYVQIDGSDVITPVDSTVNVREGDRVIVMIKGHTATVTGNLANRSPASSDLKVKDTVTGVETMVADVVQAQKADIDKIVADNVKIKGALVASDADFDKLEADGATIYGKLTASEANVDQLKAAVLDVEIADIKYANVTEALKATNIEVTNLESAYGEFSQLTSERFAAVEGSVQDLETTKLSTEDAMITYATIDFSNIGNAAVEKILAGSGLIENITVGDGTITGMLVGVTIKGDLIEGGTVVADKLVIQGEDGLYYKLNTDGVTTESEQTEYNSLNGSVITAKSITATQISVSDLVAFDATIGGFNITEDSIFSEVKDSEGNTTRGIYMDTDGQINFGDASNFIKYYRDTDGSYKLAISAASIMYALNGKQYSISDLGAIGEYVHIGTYQDEPCIELGESDSDFKLIITNTRIMFKEGAAMPAYISNQSLHITKAVIKEEIQQGEFVWKVRANGNMGLMWKGEL